MQFRVTDERTFAREFAASTADALQSGIRDGWHDYIRQTDAGSYWAGGAHPALRFRAAKQAVKRWLDERRQRDDWPEHREDWERNAEDNLIMLRYDLGERAQRLHLHVLSEDGRWLTLGPNGASGTAPTVKREVSADRAAELLEWGQKAKDHAREIDGMVAGIVSDFLPGCPEERRQQIEEVT